MPLFVFRCEKCGKEVERLCKSEDGPPECPEESCGGPMKKRMGRSSFSLKGGGWFRDGYGGG